MSTSVEHIGVILRRHWSEFVALWVAAVPDELAHCEFDCRRYDCACCTVWKAGSHGLSLECQAQPHSAKRRGR